MAGTENTYTSNNERTLVATSNANGSDAVNVYADPTTHALITSATISNSGTFPVQLNAYQTTVTGSITTATSVVTINDLMGVGAVTVSMYGTYNSVNVTFEIFDGVNWVGIPAMPISSVSPTPTLTSGLQTNATIVWNVSPLLGVAQFRVRATAWTSGTASIRIEPSAQFTQPSVVVTNPTAANLQATVTGTITAQPGVATLATGQAALSTTAAQVVAARATRRAVTIINLSGIDVYVGNTGVTTATGQLLLGIRGSAITIETVTAVFAVAASGTPSVSYLEEYA